MTLIEALSFSSLKEVGLLAESYEGYVLTVCNHCCLSLFSSLFSFVVSLI